MAYIDGRAWIDTLPSELARQASLLRRLVETLEADGRYRALEVQCSLARGAADMLSDIDAGVWIADDAFESGADDLDALLRSLRPTVDALVATLHGRPYFFVQYADGVQLDLVAQPSSTAKGGVADSIVLLDHDGLLARPYEPSTRTANPDEVHRWAFDAWLALANLDKYLRRGSTWEAWKQLEEARAGLLRLHAAQLGVPYPLFGLTSILDTPGASLPDALDQTVARLDAADLRRAATVTAAILERYEPPPLAAWVRARLATRTAQ